MSYLQVQRNIFSIHTVGKENQISHTAQPQLRKIKLGLTKIAFQLAKFLHSSTKIKRKG
jgi:hypothetical protein